MVSCGQLRCIDRLVFAFARDWIRRLHGQWFQLSDNAFDAVHYGAMAIYKIAVRLFNFAPLVALGLMRTGNG